MSEEESDREDQFEYFKNSQDYKDFIKRGFLWRIKEDRFLTESEKNEIEESQRRLAHLYVVFMTQRAYMKSQFRNHTPMLESVMVGNSEDILEGIEDKELANSLIKAMISFVLGDLYFESQEENVGFDLTMAFNNN
jgi:c-di-AMP phosphodiesterase-like protein